MSMLSTLRALFVPALRIAGAAAAGPAFHAALDGRNFDGIVLRCGETSGDADTLSFKDGRFRSTACDRYGYGDGAYTATRSCSRPRPRARSTASCSGRARCAGRASTAR